VILYVATPQLSAPKAELAVATVSVKAVKDSVSDVPRTEAAMLFIVIASITVLKQGSEMTTVTVFEVAVFVVYESRVPVTVNVWVSTQDLRLG